MAEPLHRSSWLRALHFLPPSPCHAMPSDPDRPCASTDPPASCADNTQLYTSVYIVSADTLPLPPVRPRSPLQAQHADAPSAAAIVLYPSSSISALVPTTTTTTATATSAASTTTTASTQMPSDTHATTATAAAPAKTSLSFSSFDNRRLPMPVLPSFLGMAQDTPASDTQAPAASGESAGASRAASVDAAADAAAIADDSTITTDDGVAKQDQDQEHDTKPKKSFSLASIDAVSSATYRDPFAAAAVTATAAAEPRTESRQHFPLPLPLPRLNLPSGQTMPSPMAHQLPMLNPSMLNMMLSSPRSHDYSKNNNNTNNFTTSTGDDPMAVDDHAETQVLEALTKLRSSSMGPSKASTPVTSSSPYSAPVTAGPVPPHAPVRLICFGLLERGNEAVGAKPDMVRWGCEKSFDNVQTLRTHLLHGKCVLPFTPLGKTLEGLDESSRLKIVDNALSNCLLSNEKLASDSKTGFWGTVLSSEHPFQSRLASHEGGKAKGNSTSSSSSSSLSSSSASSFRTQGQISISDLVEATIKIEEKEKEDQHGHSIHSQQQQQSAEESSSPKGKTKRSKTASKGEAKVAKKSKIFKCSFCNKVFTRKSNLDSHLITHSTERPHVCQECGKSFARLSDRTRHESTTHKATKTFQCRGVKKDGVREWGCGHFYSRADGLRKHFKSFAGKQCLYDFLRDLHGDTDELFIAFRGKPSQHQVLTTTTSAEDPAAPSSTTTVTTATTTATDGGGSTSLDGGNGGSTTFDSPEMLQNVERAIRNVRQHCGW